MALHQAVKPLLGVAEQVSPPVRESGDDLTPNGNDALFRLYSIKPTTASITVPPQTWLGELTRRIEDCSKA